MRFHSDKLCHCFLWCKRLWIFSQSQTFEEVTPNPPAYSAKKVENKARTMELDQAVSSVRCRFITSTETIRVSSDPLSIPVKLGRKGLSDVSLYCTRISLLESMSDLI